MMWNVQGLRRKLKELEEYLNNLDIIALTETWMEEKTFHEATNLLNNHIWGWVKATRIKDKGRASGG